VLNEKHNLLISVSRHGLIGFSHEHLKYTTTIFETLLKDRK